jgi:UDP-GlcNAc:undecaprenyl-phosphate GlcNAc-1-phosphate transferase
MHSRFLQYIIVFLIALLVSYFITPLIARLATTLKIVDRPARNKFHKKTTPRLGGVAIFIAYFVSLFLTKNLDFHSGIIVLGGAAIMLLGVLDDIFRVPAVIKLLFIAILTYILATEGVVLALFKDLFYLRLLITLLWIVGVTSAFNAVDNMDGLAGGLAAISALTFFIISIRTLQWEWSVFAIALFGALLGFLRHNTHPAKIFMGDSGSLFLGFTLASLAIKGGWSTNPIKASIIPILVMGVPIFDLGYIVIRRWMDGTTKGFVNAITFCAKDHFSHRLVKIGLGQKTSVLFIYLIAICSSIGAIVLQNAPKWDGVLLFLQFILIFITVLLLLNITKRMKI